MYQMLDHGRAGAGAVAVGDQLERLPVLAALAVEDEQLHPRIQRGGRRREPGGERLAHPRNGPDQQRGPDHDQLHRPFAGVLTESEALPEVHLVGLGQRGDGWLLGEHVHIGHPQRDPPRRAGFAADAVQEDLDLVDVQRGGDVLVFLQRVRGLLAVGQIDQRKPAVPVAADRLREGDRVVFLA